jgi:UDP-3-O-acyl N-acetylglucosamine deacetylase
MTAHPRPRKTLGNTATLSGEGLFTGQPCTIAFHPSEEGLRFVRGDIAAPVPVHYLALDPSPVHPAFSRFRGRSTNLARNHGMVATVEHVLSALMGLGITDCRIELDAPEAPILDGSAKPFVEALDAAGLADLPGTIDPLTLEQPVEVKAPSGPARITAEPRSEPGWSVTYELDYGQGAHLEPQTISWDGSADDYRKRIAPARTFSMDYEAKSLQSAGLFKDRTPADMLVIAKEGPIDNAYRLDNEPAAHKLLDAIGDLTLAGGPIQANITCHRSGHDLNQRMAQMFTRRFPTFVSPAKA